MMKWMQFQFDGKDKDGSQLLSPKLLDMAHSPLVEGDQMTQRRSDDERALQDLLDKLLDGSITESQHHDLQHRLRNDPVAQQAYFDYHDLDTDLREMFVAPSGISFLPASSAAAPEEGVGIGNRKQFRNWKRASIWHAIAASLLLVTSLVRWNHDTQVDLRRHRHRPGELIIYWLGASCWIMSENCTRIFCYDVGWLDGICRTNPKRLIGSQVRIQFI
jgi:hypothetical protein